MADDADQASNLLDLAQARTIKNLTSRTQAPFSGSCLYCEEPVAQARYCSSECRIAHEHESRSRRSIGKRTYTSTIIA